MAASNNGSNVNSDGLSDVIFAFAPGVPGVDLLSEPVIAELTRRLKGFVGSGVSGAIVYGSTPPQDKSKLWDKGDGQLYRYDPVTGTWITGDNSDTEIYPGLSADAGQQIIEKADGLYYTQIFPRFIQEIVEITGTGAQTIPVSISPAFENADYAVSVQPGYANTAAWYVSGKTESLCTIVYEDPGWVLGTTFVNITLIEKITEDNFTA
jgi:hypothetical protein